jgi:protein-disulfide isomerase
MDEIEETGKLLEGTLTFKRSHVYATLLPLAFVIGLSVGYLFWGRKSEAVVQPTPQVIIVTQSAPQEAKGGEAQAQAPQATSQPDSEAGGGQAAGQEQKVTRYDIPEDDDPSFGPEDAVITIIEFSDFECPFCRKWHTETWPLLLESYGDQIRLVYRDFPLTTMHQNATPAAAAANCAGEQNAYWDFHEKLYSSDSLNQATYQTYANDLGLDMEAFNECLDSGRQTEEVQADYEFAANLGVRSTPTFFVNGIPLVGAQPFEVFKEVIDKELAGEFE